MIGYRDRTFCPYWESCAKGRTCDRALTPEVKAAAERWWGNPGAPISQFWGVPECYEAKKDE